MSDYQKAFDAFKRDMSTPRTQEELDLLSFLTDEVWKWTGEPIKRADGSELRYFPRVHIYDAILKVGNTFSASFVMHLFTYMNMRIGFVANMADEYGRFYNNPHKTLDEKKREHDKRGHGQISKDIARNAALVKHEKEFLKACGDVKPFFDAFMLGKQGKTELTILGARGKPIHRDKWGLKTFVDYCADNNVGYGKDISNYPKVIVYFSPKPASIANTSSFMSL